MPDQDAGTTSTCHLDQTSLRTTSRGEDTEKKNQKKNHIAAIHGRVNNEHHPDAQTAQKLFQRHKKTCDTNAQCKYPNAQYLHRIMHEVLLHVPFC